LFLIDGYALIYRAFFALIQRPLTTSRGENTSAAFGFTRFLLKVLEDHEPDYLAVVLDAGSSQRSVRYPAYKATREKMPSDLEASLPRIRQLMEAFRFAVLEIQDMEADDVIGTLALRAKEHGLEAVIVSGDKDFYQLIRDGVSLLNPGRGGSAMVEEEWVDLRNASERLGVPPEQVTDYLALIGDSSDNIPGARGIGPKTAIQLIEEYGSVHVILAHAEEIKQKRAREALIAAADDVRLSKDLVTILTDVPVTLDLDALTRAEPDRDQLRELFVDMEFHSLASELGAPEQMPTQLEHDYETVDTVEGLQRLVERARAAGVVGLDVESASGAAMRGELVGIGIAVAPGEAVYLPFAHRRPGVLDLEGVQVTNLPAIQEPAMHPLRELLEDGTVRKIGHDLKKDFLLLLRNGIRLDGIEFDTMIASYVIDPGRRDHGKDSLALQYLRHKARTREELCGRGRDEVPIAECGVEATRDYTAETADIALRLRPVFAEQLEKSELDVLFREIEMPLLPVLADMERVGIRIDREFFARVGVTLARDLHLIQEEIWKVAGEQFNINSTPQLRTILFDKLQLPVLRKTKTGASTDAAVLEELAEQGHTLPRLLIEFRQIDKLKGTYVDALPHQVNPETGRIHTTFSQTVAATGRLSSSDPNLQNIPIRTEQGAELRKGFIPADGYVFLGADYSQIELRILAHMSGDPAFVEAFRSGRDIHRQTAAIMFGVPVEDVTGQMRAAAKTVNFATIYGIGPFALSRQLGTSVAEAKTFIEQYFERFPGVRHYLDQQIEMARECGYVETLSGRRRYIPEIRTRNYSMRQFGERAATNAPVQGTAADIIKIAMIRIHHALRDSDLGARMLLQVHDELVFEAPAGRVDETRALVKRLMEDAFALDVPLEVETGVGNSWYECK
ncbi:MAG: DNA polymerase I, partial [Longimicrobiales bacterium]